MSDVPANEKKIYEEDIERSAPSSESMWQKIAGSINWILINMQSTSIGQIKASMLTEAQFQSTAGTGWVLCDGRSVAGSEYESVTGNSTIPDLRGSFIRGKKNGVSNPLAPSVPETALGDSQPTRITTHEQNYQVISHNFAEHYTVGGILTRESGGDRFGVTDPAVEPTIDIIANTIGESATESRPRNVTMNWFVRIN